MSDLTLRFGTLAPALNHQLREQGVELDAKDVEHWERDIDAVNRLGVRGVLTLSEAERARRRIFKQVHKAAVAAGGGS